MRKLLVCMMMLVALFSLSGAAMAQTPSCGNLSAADCDILTQSAAAQAGLTSATFNFTLNIDAGGQAIPLTGNGSYAIDPAVVASMQGMDMTNMTDPTAMLAALGDVVKGFDAELNVNAMGMIDLNLLLIDGIGYFNFASVAPLLGGPQALTGMGLPAGWGGLDLIGALDMLAPMLAGMDMSQMQTQVDPAAQQQIMDSVLQHVTISRSADVDGQAVFVTSVDFAGLFQDQAFLDYVMTQANTGGEITDAQMEQVTQMLAGLGGSFTFSATQKIDLSSFHATSVGFNFLLNGAALTAITGETVGDVTVSGEFNFADFNAAPALSAPADAPVATIMDLMGMMGGMGGM